MGPTGADRTPRLAVALLTGAAFVLHLALSARTTGPWVVPDEAGYLGTARWLAGQRDWVMTDVPFYSSGYAVLVAPLAAVARDPELQWRATVALNAALLATVLPLLHLILRRVLGVPWRRALTAACAGALAPGVLAAGYMGASENLALPLLLLSVLALHGAVVGRSWRTVWWFGPAVALLPFAHARFVLVLPVALAVLALGAVRRSLRPATAGANLVGLVAVTLGARIVNVRVRSSRWRTVATPEGDLERWRQLATTRAGIRELLLTAAGQTWYLLAGSLVLVAVGVGVVAWRVVRPSPIAPLATGVTAPRGQRLCATYVVGAAAVVFATSVAFFAQNQFRLDHYVYGRHNDSFAPLWIAAALSFLLGPVAIRRRLAALAAGAAVLGGATIVLVHGRDPLAFRSAVSTFSVPAVLRPMRWDEARAFTVPAAVGLLGAAAIAALLALELLGRRPRSVRWGVVARVTAVLAVTAWFATAGVDGSDRAAGYDRMQYEGWQGAEVARRLGVDRLAIDVGAAGGRPALVYPYFLPDTSIRPYVGGAEAPAAPFAIAPVDDRARRDAGDRLAFVDQRYSYRLRDELLGVGIWVAPGPEQDALDERGALLPDGWPAELPASARAAALDIVDDVDEPLRTSPGGRVPLDVEVTHTGAGAPWPDLASWPASGHVRVVALVEPLDPDGIEGARSGGELDAWMLPGDADVIRVEVVAIGQFLEPLPAGRYRVELAVAQDGYDWEAPGGPSATFTLEVAG